MKMKRNVKVIPINPKKTKVQFSTRLSGCLGDHQSQEFFDRVSITRQSGICSKNKNNSFGDRRSNSFRQSLQLNVPFVADFSDSKQLCLCYPVHFFRKKSHSYDSEDNRFASVRVYFPASRMKNGNDFKMSLDCKKRFTLSPHQYEFVGFSSLLTLSLEDLSLAVFRAKSSSEKFKIMTSFAIPKVLISSAICHNQTGTPIFIATERIYSRILKLIACFQSDAFKLNHTSTLNTESNLHLRKCLLTWIGLEDFLPLSSRIIFVRRVSSDSGETLGSSILNSPGPKLRRTRVKENDRLSIRLKQVRLDNSEEFEDDSKDMFYSEEGPENSEKMLGCDSKRPRGRPRKSLDTENVTLLISETDTTEEESKRKEEERCLVDKIKSNSSQLKSESTSNSMTDSTSEEKYSVQLSSCTTPDTNKSCSPVIPNETLTTSVNSTPSIMQQFILTKNDATKNKRGRPRKYPLSIQIEEKAGKSQTRLQDSEDSSKKRRKRSNSNTLTETSIKVFRSSHSSLSSTDGNVSKILNPGMELSSSVIADQLKFVSQSIWRPLKNALSAPDTIVPFTKSLSNTGLGTGRKLKLSSTQPDPFVDEKPFPKSSTHKFLGEATLENLSKSQASLKIPSYLGLCGLSPHKSLMKEVEYHPSSSHTQYLVPGTPGGFNPMMVPPPNLPSTSYGSGLLSPLINNLFNSNGSSLSSCQSPIMNTLASLFSPISTPNPLKMQFLPSSPSFYDTSCRTLYSNNHFPDSQISPTYPHNISQSLHLQQYNSMLLANKYDSGYPHFSSWNNDYQWKY